MRKIFILLIFSFFIAATNPLAASDDISAYLIAGHMSTDDAETKLKDAGFDVITRYKLDKKGTLTSVLFTNSALKKDANKKNRAFAAILRLLVDDKNKQLSIDNPVYFAKALLQDNYNEATAIEATAALKKVFGDMKNSKDKLAADDISGYHFMMGMPYYEDMVQVGKGKCTQLLEKAKSYKKGKNLVFELKLADNRYIIGYKLGKKTAKFTKKIGTNNAQLLPYTILIEDGEAKILAPKYYIAVSYPLLSMTEFTKIATVPGAIEKDLAKPFK